MAGASIQQMADRVAQLLEERLRLRGKGLDEKLRRGGRLLPKKVRAAAEVLVRAASMAQNPRLLMQIDHGQVAAAYDLCLAHLTKVNAGERRKTALIGVLASVAFSLLAVGVLVLVVVYLRGLI